MTYTCDTTHASFFVVGGNADGTESGRVYAYYYENTANPDKLFSYSNNPTNFMVWDKSQWTSDTMIVLTSASYAFSNAAAAYFGFSTASDAITSGIGGNILFSGVKIL